MEELKVGTWFTGIGAPEMAIKELGIPHRNVMAAEWDKYATQTYLANFKPEQMFGDVTKIECESIEQLDIFIAGPPCQAFSLAGNRLGFDDVRGTLFFNCADFIKKNRPKYFILENVKGLLSHDKPKGSKSKYGRTFNTIVNLLAATVNYQETMFPYEDNLGYNIHYRVLNAKNFGSPQNRERIFIIGIRPDLPNDYRFPLGEPLKLRLKDILEPVVDEKYYLSDKIIAGFINHAKRQKEKGNGFKFEPILNTNDQIAKCITARVFKMGGDDNYIQDKTTENTIAKTITTEKGSRGYNNFIQDPFCVALRGREDADKEEFGPKNKQQLEPREDGITNTITSVQKDNLIYEPGIIQYNIPEMVSVRKFNVDIVRLQACLKECRRDNTIKSIADYIGVPKTMAEHWFRTDGGFSIPDAIYWLKLKEFLKIETNEFDASIMEFLEKPNEFDKSNRVYDSNGIAPTITCGSADEKIMLNPDVICHNMQPRSPDRPSLKYSSGGSGYLQREDGLTYCLDTGATNAVEIKGSGRIRRLTPKECFRLQAFPDSYIKPCSDSQTYKQAGNSINVNCIRAVIKNLLVTGGYVPKPEQ